MQKCKEGEHQWIVIGWATGAYSSDGKFVPRHAANNDDYRAREFMCQRCLEIRDANILLLHVTGDS